MAQPDREAQSTGDDPSCYAAELIESLIPGWEFREAVRHVFYAKDSYWLAHFVRNLDTKHIYARGTTLRDALSEAIRLCTAADTALQCNA